MNELLEHNYHLKMQTVQKDQQEGGQDSRLATKGWKREVWGATHGNFRLGNGRATDSTTPKKRKKKWVGSWCSAINCSASGQKNPDRSFHGFPSDPDRSEQWVVATRRADFVGESAARLSECMRLCSAHFLPEDYLPHRRFLRKTAVPSVFDFSQGSRSRRKPMTSAREYRLGMRRVARDELLRKQRPQLKTDPTSSNSGSINIDLSERGDALRLQARIPPISASMGDLGTELTAGYTTCLPPAVKRECGSEGVENPWRWQKTLLGPGTTEPQAGESAVEPNVAESSMVDVYTLQQTAHMTPSLNSEQSADSVQRRSVGGKGLEKRQGPHESVPLVEWPASELLYPATPGLLDDVQLRTLRLTSGLLFKHLVTMHAAQKSLLRFADCCHDLKEQKPVARVADNPGSPSGASTPTDPGVDHTTTDSNAAPSPLLVLRAGARDHPMVHHSIAETDAISADLHRPLHPLQAWETIAQLREKLLAAEHRALQAQYQAETNEIQLRSYRREMCGEYHKRIDLLKRKLKRAQLKLDTVKVTGNTKYEKDMLTYLKEEMNTERQKNAQMLKVLTPAQVETLRTGKRHVFAEEDIRRGLEIRRRMSRNAYRYLREEMGFPLPTPTALCNAAKRIPALQPLFKQVTTENLRKLPYNKKYHAKSEPVTVETMKEWKRAREAAGLPVSKPRRRKAFSDRLSIPTGKKCLGKRKATGAAGTTSDIPREAPLPEDATAVCRRRAASQDTGVSSRKRPASQDTGAYPGQRAAAEDTAAIRAPDTHTTTREAESAGEAQAPPAESETADILNWNGLLDMVDVRFTDDEDGDEEETVTLPGSSPTDQTMGMGLESEQATGSRLVSDSLPPPRRVYGRALARVDTAPVGTSDCHDAGSSDVVMFRSAASSDRSYVSVRPTGVKHGSPASSSIGSAGGKWRGYQHAAAISGTLHAVKSAPSCVAGRAVSLAAPKVVVVQSPGGGPPLVKMTRVSGPVSQNRVNGPEVKVDPLGSARRPVQFGTPTMMGRAPRTTLVGHLPSVYREYPRF